MIVVGIVVGLTAPILCGMIGRHFARKDADEVEHEFLHIRIHCSKCGHVGGFVRRDEP